MGILAGFIGGTARAAGQIADQRIARYTAEEMQRQRDLMDQERERRIEEAQIAREGRAVAQRDKDRTDTVSRIDTEAGRIADVEVAKERGLIFSKQELLEQTPEWQAQKEQELAEKRQAIASDNNTRFKASVNTGDTSQERAQAYFDSERRIDLSEKQQENAGTIAAMRDATDRYKAELKEAADIRKDERLEAMIRSVGGGASGKNEKVMTFLEGTRKSLNSESDRLTELMKSELKTAEFNPDEQVKIRDAYKQQFDQIKQQQQNLNDDFNQVRQKFGLPAREDKKEPSSQDASDPFAAAFNAGLKEVQGSKNPQSQVTNSSSPTSNKAIDKSGLMVPKTVDIAARDAEIARMNTLSGSSSKRESAISKKQEEVTINFEEKLSQIKRGMDRKQAFNVLSWIDDNSSYMTPAQIKQVRDAKRAAGM